MKTKLLFQAILYVLMFCVIPYESYAQERLYGTAPNGGAYGKGTLFSVANDGSDFKVEHDIYEIDGLGPVGKPLKASNGKYYGFTVNGSKANAIFYEYDPITKSYTVLHYFGDYKWSYEIIQGTDGKLYFTVLTFGTARYGLIYSYNIENEILNEEYRFDTASAKLPGTGLVETEPGIFYGTFSYAETDPIDSRTGGIFQFKTNDKSLTVKASFADDNIVLASHPMILASNGNLYGTSPGYLGEGSKLFEFNLSSETLKVLYDFGVGPTEALGGISELKPGVLYGQRRNETLGNELYQFNLNADEYSVVDHIDGSNNQVGELLLASNGLGYGVIHSLTDHEDGSMFSIDPTTNEVSIVEIFNEFKNPHDSLAEIEEGILTGISSEVYDNSAGNLYEYDLSSRKFSSLLVFQANEGDWGNALIQVDNLLYGFSYTGGKYNKGNIYSFDPETKLFTELFPFDQSSGHSPYGNPVFKDGFLYGTTVFGGTDDAGTLFRYEIATGNLTTLHHFTKELGRCAGSAMIASDGNLYGFTSSLVDYQKEMIFSYNLTSNLFTKEYEFKDGEARFSFGYFVEYNNKLYAMSSDGGAESSGAIFQFDLNTKNYSSEFNFSTITGLAPTGSLLLASNNKFYGYTMSALTGTGTNIYYVFEFDPETSDYKIIHTQTSELGNISWESSLMEHEGKLFGHTVKGGSNDKGVVFSIDIEDYTYTKLKDLDTSTGFEPFGHFILFSPISEPDFYIQDFESEDPITNIRNSYGSDYREDSLSEGASACVTAAKGTTEDLNSANVDFNSCQNNSEFVALNPEQCGGYNAALLKTENFSLASATSKVYFSGRYFVSSTLGYGAGTLLATISNDVTSFSALGSDIETYDQWVDFKYEIPADLYTAGVSLSISMEGGEGMAIDDIHISEIIYTTDPKVPIITLSGNNPQTLEMGAGYTELGATTDDGSTLNIDASNFKDEIGTYTIFYDSTNDCGLEAIQITRTVNVVDTTAPVIALNGESPQVLEVGNPYTELGATTDDGSDITIDNSEYREEVGTYSIYYNSTDASGNVAIEVVRTVIVENRLSNDDIDFKTHLAVYPNPTKGMLQINKEVKKIQLYNIAGQKVMEGEGRQIDISNLPSGVYFAQMSIDNGNDVFKVVKD